MKIIHYILICLVFSSSVFANEGDKALGLWLVEKKDAIIQVYKVENKYFGKLVWLLDLHTGKKKELLDKENPDESLRKKSLQGLINLRDFVYEDGEWIDGTVYDPQNGKTYSAKMSMDDKDHLNLRGYVGIPLFGRTASWTRVKAIPEKGTEIKF